MNVEQLRPRPVGTWLCCQLMPRILLHMASLLLSAGTGLFPEAAPYTSVSDPSLPGCVPIYSGSSVRTSSAHSAACYKQLVRHPPHKAWLMKTSWVWERGRGEDHHNPDWPSLLRLSLPRNTFQHLVCSPEGHRLRLSV